jgi:uncharacterized membrane protein YbhN (UPF0104 family)
LSTVALVVVGLVGAQLRGIGMLCAAVGGVVGVAVLLGAASTLAALVWASRRPRRLAQLATLASARCNAALRLVAPVAGGPPQAAPTAAVTIPRISEGCADSDGHLIGPGRAALALGLATMNWVADIMALAVAFLALGLDVPWQGLLLAYAITQAATTVPLLPGSLGVAEGSMTAALVCAGVRPTAALAGVLVYRLVSFWLVLPTGWLAWTWLRRGETRLPVAGSRAGPTAGLV